MRVSKLPKLKLPWLWDPITLHVNLRLKWSLKQSCSPYQELSNGMSHTTCMQGNWVDSKLLVVGSQIANLTPDPSFRHNLCFTCQNESCKPILNIYVLRALKWYKELFKPLSFDPCNRPLKVWESIGTPSPKVGVALGVWGFIPSHFPTLSEACGVTPMLPFGPQPCKPLCFGCEPKARVVTRWF
jgi:hypothetical protein